MLYKFSYILLLHLPLLLEDLSDYFVTLFDYFLVLDFNIKLIDFN